MSTTKLKGKIKVASRIVDHLSSGLYESPSACLKELINNSFDADASIVNVFVKPDADRIIIEDDGHGMNAEEFEKHFKSVSESYKRVENEVTKKFKRKKIGKIGIGFIAANEICDELELISTKKDSSDELNVKINFAEIRKDPQGRIKNKKGELDKADYEGEVLTTDKEKSYTYIFLKKIRGDAKDILRGVGTTEHMSGSISLYGKSHKSICEILKNKKIRSWSEFDTYSKNMLEIGLNVPVRYHDEWLPAGMRKKVSSIVSEVENLNFKVFFDGTEIRKPIVFSPKEKNEKSLIEKFEFEGTHVSANGYFYAQDTGIKPQELQGILTRIRNASIGKYDSGFLGFSPSTNPLLQSWISGELYVDDRLEDAMNIDRKTLRITHPSYVELQKEIHSHVDKLLKRVRSDIYGSGTKERKKIKAEKITQKVREITDKSSSKIDKKTKAIIKEAWSIEKSTEKNQKNVLKKYTIDELYEVILDVASEVLDESQFNIFIRELTKRLNN